MMYVGIISRATRAESLFLILRASADRAKMHEQLRVRDYKLEREVEISDTFNKNTTYTVYMKFISSNACSL
jgi:hypothetical protein